MKYLALGRQGTTWSICGPLTFLILMCWKNHSLESLDRISGDLLSKGLPSIESENDSVVCEVPCPSLLFCSLRLNPQIVFANVSYYYSPSPRRQQTNVACYVATRKLFVSHALITLLGCVSHWRSAWKIGCTITVLLPFSVDMWFTSVTTTTLKWRTTLPIEPSFPQSRMCPSQIPTSTDVSSFSLPTVAAAAAAGV